MISEPTGSDCSSHERWSANHKGVRLGFRLGLRFYVLQESSMPIKNFDAQSYGLAAVLEVQDRPAAPGGPQCPGVPRPRDPQRPRVPKAYTGPQSPKVPKAQRPPQGPRVPTAQVSQGH